MRNYLHKDAGKIYFFDEDDASFKLLYDFTLEVGDTMVYETGIHSWDLKRRTHYLRIDSVGTYIADGWNLKRYVGSYGSREGSDQVTFYESNTVILEDIGNTSNFFHFSDDTGFCDDRYSDTLRCFSSPNFPLVKFSDTDCLRTSVKNIKRDLQIEIYPNPFISELYLKAPLVLNETQIKVYDLNGSLVYRSLWSPNSAIQFHSLKPDVYFLVLSDAKNNQPIFTQKVLKIN